MGCAHARYAPCCAGGRPGAEAARRAGPRRDDEKSAEPDGLVPGSMDADNREATIREALGLDSASQEATAKVAELVEHSRVTQARLDEIKSMQEPDLDEDLTPNQAWAMMLGREREALLQPAEMYLSLAPRSKPTTISGRR